MMHWVHGTLGPGPMVHWVLVQGTLGLVHWDWYTGTGTLGLVTLGLVHWDWYTGPGQSCMGLVNPAWAWSILHGPGHPGLVILDLRTPVF